MGNEKFETYESTESMLRKSSMAFLPVSILINVFLGFIATNSRAREKAAKMQLELNELQQREAAYEDSILQRQMLSAWRNPSGASLTPNPLFPSTAFYNGRIF